MKIKPLVLCAVMANLFPSCITLTGQLNLPGGEKSGGFGGTIGGSWSWPQKPEPEPALPQDFGKNPVPVQP